MDNAEWHARLQEIWSPPDIGFRSHHGMTQGAHGFETLSEIEGVADMSFKGDRYFGDKPAFKGQVTFLNADSLDAVREHSRQPDLSSSTFRRNLIVCGFELSAWMGKRFRFQSNSSST